MKKIFNIVCFSIIGLFTVIFSFLLLISYNSINSSILERMENNLLSAASIVSHSTEIELDDYYDFLENRSLSSDFYKDIDQLLVDVRRYDMSIYIVDKDGKELNFSFPKISLPCPQTQQMISDTFNSGKSNFKLVLNSEDKSISGASYPIKNSNNEIVAVTVVEVNNYFILSYLKIVFIILWLLILSFMSLISYLLIKIRNNILSYILKTDDIYNEKYFGLIGINKIKSSIANKNNLWAIMIKVDFKYISFLKEVEDIIMYNGTLMMYKNDILLILSSETKDIIDDMLIKINDAYLSYKAYKKIEGDCFKITVSNTFEQGNNILSYLEN